ncbi:MAG: hypothetical protein HN712_13970, partial [Gemmatimonadetes bacterium]|nr:hypothetical protein [Gemmatimonadota bacterium]
PAEARIKASLYAHPGQGLLIIAGNFNPEQMTATIELDLAAFGLEDKTCTAVNALTDQPIPIGPDGTLTPTIAAKSFVLMRVE